MNARAQADAIVVLFNEQPWQFVRDRIEAALVEARREGREEGQLEAAREGALGYPLPPLNTENLSPAFVAALAGAEFLGRLGTRLPDQLTLDAIAAETLRARLKFPGRKRLLAALFEEGGELAKALLQNRPKAEIQKEAVQVAAVAVRIIEEGDADFDVVSVAEALP